MKKTSKVQAATKVLVNFVQDRSGSMQTAWKETLNGFKVFVEGLQAKGKEDNVEYVFTLTTFDTLVETPVVAKAIIEVSPEELEKHAPRGMTALYDAVGATIELTDKDRHGAEKIICVIVTDGQENSSREWDKLKINAAIDAKLKAGDWTFTYLGTQPETWGDAAVMGMAAGASANFNPLRAQAAYAVTMDAVHNLSRSADMSSSNLYASEHADPVAMASAGMSTQNGTGNAPIVVPQVAIPPVPPLKHRRIVPPAAKKLEPVGRWR